MSPRRTAFLAGVRAELPILLGVLPFGMIYGASALAAGLSPLMAQAMSVVVFAGSAQFVIVQLVAENVPPLVIGATAFIVNLRHLLYSASIAPYLRKLAARHRRLLAYLLTDEAYTVSIIHFQRQPDEPAPGWYLAGAGMALWTTWQLSTAAGIFLGASLPAWLPLDFALPLTFWPGGAGDPRPGDGGRGDHRRRHRPAGPRAALRPRPAGALRWPASSPVLIDGAKRTGPVVAEERRSDVALAYPDRRGHLTYLQRVLFLGSGDDRPGDTLLRRGLRFVPASVLVGPDRA